MAIRSGTVCAQYARGDLRTNCTMLVRRGRIDGGFCILSVRARTMLSTEFSL